MFVPSPWHTCFGASCGQKAKLLAQERSSTTEAQLAETTSQLHNLKLKQKELEARNALLEKLARLDKQHKVQQESPTNGCNVLLWQVTPWPITLWLLLPAFLYCSCWLFKGTAAPISCCQTGAQSLLCGCIG